jgi:hypothetical protein
MKKHFIFLLLASILFFLINSCDGNKPTSTDKTDNEAEKAEETKKEYVVTCDNMIIMQGPGEDSGGVIDEKASEITGTESYSAVWAGYKVKVLETKADWSKIETVGRPNTVIGWIPSSCIE